MSETTTSTSTADRPWQSYHTVYTNAKAGMDGVDKEKVQKVVYEMSKGSKYFENEERKEAFIKEKIENMRAQCAKLTEMDISHHQMVADKRMLELEAGRDLTKTWLHVDMDAFYAAVETLANPSLKGKPMAVGSMSMISTANYEARRFGVRAAMPGFIARKLCPELIFVPVDFKKYTHYSDLTRKVFQKYDPNFIACSLDEAYLGITEVCKERGMSSGEIAGKLRTDIYEETGLTCSAGVAPNLLLAKVCSDIEKPNGQYVLPNNRMAITTFIASLPIRKIGGIGKVTEHTLRDVLGINTCEELLQKRAFIFALFSHSSADFFLSVGLGLGKTDAPQVRLRKSISTERTFSATEDEVSLYHILADIAEMLATDMHKEGLRGRTLTLKLKTASFEVRSRAVSLQKCIYSSDEILNHAKKLLKAELPLSLRLIGLRMSQFNDFKLGPVDPLQKTLTNFVITGETSGKVMCGQSSSGTDIIDNHLISDTEIGHHIDAHKSCHSDSDYIYESGNPMDSNLFHHLECSNQNKSNDADEKDRACPTLSNDCASKVINPDSNGCVTQSHEAGGVQTVETGSCSLSGHFKSEPIGVNKGDNLLDKDAVLSLDHKQLSWVDDYKCSLCGTELPPNFVEERQEHSDYHFAEMLQKEESGHNARDIRPRSTQKAKVTTENKRKKQKTSPKDGKYIPIDVFFVKTNQNF